MHIGVLTGFVYFLCRLLTVRPDRSVWIAMVFAILYGLLTVPSPPILRSVLMCVAVGAGLILRRRLAVIHLLALCFVIILLIQPMDLFNPGFQLSFACVAGLMLLASRLSSFFLSLENEHVRIARRIQRPTGLALWRLKARIMFINALAAGLIAWLVSMPLIAFHFRQINPWAIPASILLAPAVATTLICGLLKVVFTLLIPASAGLLAVSTEWSASAMRWMVSMMAAMPGSEAPMPPIPLAAMLAYFALLLAPLVPRWRETRRVWIAPAIAALLGISIPLIALAASRHLSTAVRLTCLSVGAGSSSVIELPGGRAIMVDCGAGGPGIYQRVIDPFLRSRGVTRIDTLYLTHGDSDHTNAAAELLASGRVHSLAVHEGQAGIAPVLAAAHQAGIEVRTLHRGDRVDHGSTRIDVLWPLEGELLQGNDASLVLRLESAGQSILFPGDIGERPRHELADNASHADILIAPHHGSATAWTAELLAAVSPRAIVSSDGQKVAASQAKFQELAHPLPLYHTRNRGAITVELSAGHAPHITTWIDDRVK
jgi:competence protein ComEC